MGTLIEGARNRRRWKCKNWRITRSKHSPAEQIWLKAEFFEHSTNADYDVALNTVKYMLPDDWEHWRIQIHNAGKATEWWYVDKTKGECSNEQKTA
jgi:hypothetical protein